MPWYVKQTATTLPCSRCGQPTRLILWQKRGPRPATDTIMRMCQDCLENAWRLVR